MSSVCIISWFFLCHVKLTDCQNHLHVGSVHLCGYQPKDAGCIGGDMVIICLRMAMVCLKTKII